MEIQRRRHNKIHKLKNPLGAVVTSQSEIEGVFKNYLQQIFLSFNPYNLNMDKGTKGVASKVSMDMNNSLIARFIKEEVVVALKQMEIPWP